MKTQNFGALRAELHGFYLQGDRERAEAFAAHCFAIMDERCDDTMSITTQKLLQYDVITEEFDPVVFRTVPYYYETGVLTSLSDGAAGAKGYSFVQANGWTYLRNRHKFVEQDPQLYEKVTAQKAEQLYLICGAYNDVLQHFNFNCRPFLQIGLKGICEKAEAELKNVQNEE